MNTHCDSLRDDLLAYGDGELPLVRRWAVQWHLAHCAACREEVAIMEQISAELQQAELQQNERAGRPEFGSALRSRILSSIASTANGETAATATDSAAAGSGDRKDKGSPWSGPQWRVLLQRYTFALSGVALIAFVILNVTGKKISNTFNSASNTMMDSVSVPSAGAGASADYSEAPKAVAVAPSAPQSNESVRLAAREKWAPAAKRDANVMARSGSGSAPVAVESSPTLDSQRRVHREARMTVAVGDIEEQSTQVTGLVKAADGYVTNNTLATGQTGNKTATMEVRVPVKQFDGLIASISKLGKVTAKNVTGEDVTEEYSDAEQADQVMYNDLAIKEAQLKQAMERQAKGKLSEAELWQQRVETRQMRIQAAQARARLDLLRKMSELANISVQLEEKPRTASEGGFLSEMGDTGRSAMDSFLMAIRIPITALIWILAYAPLWIPVLLVWRLFSRTHSNRGL